MTQKISSKKDPRKNLDEMLKKHWPTAKQDMEKGIKEAKKAIATGEKHLGKLTDKSMKHLRIVVLNQRKDTHHREMGKRLASLSKKEWADDGELAGHLDELDTIDKEIASLQKELSKKGKS